MIAGASPARRILLIGWDAADWRVLRPLLDEGAMPALRGLMERGAWGNLATLEPMVSPMLWTTIATGVTADRHGVLGFVEPGPGGRGIRPWRSRSRRRPAVWNFLHRHGKTCQVAGWWAGHPAERLRGTVVSRAFLDAADGGIPLNSVHPPEAAAALAPLRLRPSELSGDDLLAFVPRAAEICQESDRRLAVLAKIVSDTATMQAVTLHLLTAPQWDFTAVYFDGIDHFCHAFMRYCPPRQPGVSEDDVALYGEVVRAGCRFHDRLLAEQLRAAGPETTVILCSDHGFMSGDARPAGVPADPCGPVLWHRDTGIFAMAGPGVRPVGEIHGSSLLDVAPTVLALAGLSATDEMPGRVLTDALDGVAVPARIPAGDEPPGDDGRHPPEDADPPPDDSLTAHLIALGYLEDHRGDPDAAGDAAAVEAAWNLCQVLISTSRAADAVPQLLDLLHRRPWETRFILQLANALARSGRFRECIALIADAWPDTTADPPPAVAQLLLARAHQGTGDADAARRCVADAARAIPRLPGARVEFGSLLLALGRPEPAARAFRQALAIDPDFAPAFEGLSAVHLRARRFADALAAAQRAIRAVPRLPGAHLYAGIALTRLGRHAEARESFARLTEIAPLDPAPWRWLAALPPPDAAGGFARDACRERARLLARNRAAARRHAAAAARQPLAPLPALPPPAERRALARRHRGPAADRRTEPTLTIVSGLPRSGTSMMMQMLAAGGLPPHTDGIRRPDASNPAGYFEWEPVKQLPRNPDILADPLLPARALKVVSPLVPSLPDNRRYRIVFLTRPAADIARSQLLMLARSATSSNKGEPPDPESLTRSLADHSARILRFLRARPDRFDLLVLDYDTIRHNPPAAATTLATFLGPRLLPNAPRAAAAVTPAAPSPAHSASP